MNDGDEAQMAKEPEVVLERVSDAVYAVDTEWRFTYVNERAETLLDRTEGELLGTVLWDAFPEAADEPAIYDAHRRSMETGETVEVETYSPPLETWFEARVYSSDTGQSVYFRDITERKRREQELAQYETILETMDDGVYRFDADSNIKLVNGTFASMTGYDREELIGSHASLLTSDDTVFEAETMQRELERGKREVATLEVGLQTADGETIPTETRFTLLPTDGGSYDRIGVIRDITEHKRREEQLERSNAELERFAYVASHDLQEPLRMVSSYVQLLERRYADELDDDAQEFIDYAVDGTTRMREMIDDLLEYSRVGRRDAEFEPTECDDVLDEVLENLQVAVAESNAEITSDSLPTVVADPRQLQVVFQNLVANAIKYSGDEPPRIHVSAERRADEWILSVEDNGIGIESDETEQVFEVFSRLHGNDDYSGTGIGLSICKKIVERHGGGIRVESDPGEGSTFYFTLPSASDRGGEDRS